MTACQHLYIGLRNDAGRSPHRLMTWRAKAMSAVCSQQYNRTVSRNLNLFSTAPLPSPDFQDSRSDSPCHCRTRSSLCSVPVQRRGSGLEESARPVGYLGGEGMATGSFSSDVMR